MTDKPIPPQTPDATQVRARIKCIDELLHSKDGEAAHVELHELAHEFEVLAAQSPVLPPSGVEGMALKALKRLTNEIAGIWDAFEYGIRHEISNTNYAVVREKITEAESVIAALSASVAGEATGMVSVELLQTERDTADRLREENAKLRTEIAALKHDIERLMAINSECVNRPALDAGTVEAVCRRYLESALRWHEVFEDGRGGNDLSLHDTLNMMVDRMVRALASPAPSGEPDDEAASLLERLRNPQWVHGSVPFESPQLDKEQTVADMAEAAWMIDALCNAIEIERRAAPASNAEAVAWRWKPKGAELWIYNPEARWFAEQSLNAIDVEPLYAAPCASKPDSSTVQTGNDLASLRQAIIDHTHGDLFWIGEILLGELEKETGFTGAVSQTSQSGGE